MGLFTVPTFSYHLGLMATFLCADGLVQTLTCVFKQPPGKRSQRLESFASASSFTWTSRPFFYFLFLFCVCHSELGYSALSLSISVIVNAGNQFLKSCLLFESQSDQLCFFEKFRYRFETSVDMYDIFFIVARC